MRFITHRDTADRQPPTRTHTISGVRDLLQRQGVVVVIFVHVCVCVCVWSLREGERGGLGVVSGGGDTDTLLNLDQLYLG